MLIQIFKMKNKKATLLFIASIHLFSLQVLAQKTSKLELKNTNATQVTENRKRPNIVVILVDDMRWDEYGEAGHNYLKTPNIDRLAKEGASFVNAFATTPLCSPSRASFLTGQYAHTNGIIDNTADWYIPKCLSAATKSPSPIFTTLPSSLCITLG